MNFKTIIPWFAALVLQACIIGGGTGGEGIQAGNNLRGVIVDGDGNPVANARVLAYDLSVPDAIPDSTSTESSGDYRFRKVVKGRFNIVVMRQSGDTAFAAFVQDVSAEEARFRAPDTLRRAGSVRISATVADTVVTSMTCEIPSSPWSAVGDSVGECRLGGVAPGQVPVRVTIPGVAVTNVPVHVGEGDHGSHRTVRLDGTGSLQPPLQPTLLAPAPDTAGVGWPIAFRWSSPPDEANASHYRLQISSDSLFGTLSADDSLSYAPDTQGVTRYALGGLGAGQSYFWRVLAVGAGGAAASETRTFTTTSVGEDWRSDTLSGYTFMIPPAVVMTEEFFGVDSWFARYAGDSVSFTVEGGFILEPDRSPERPEYAERFLPRDSGSALLITAHSDTTSGAGYFAGLYVYTVDSAEIDSQPSGPAIAFTTTADTPEERDLAVRIFEGVRPLEP